jgi:hypothetical protein
VNELRAEIVWVCVMNSFIPTDHIQDYNLKKKKNNIVPVLRDCIVIAYEA